MKKIALLEWVDWLIDLSSEVRVREVVPYVRATPFFISRSNKHNI